MVLIDVFSDVFKEDIISFRPLAGIMVLIVQNCHAERSASPGRFRPLAGIMVLILWTLRV